jgi:phenylacetate-coenzyme A ligase PaaK-like adenylate-forming protein
VFPAGVGQTEMQVQAIADLKPTGYIGTPSFLKIIIEKADELKADISSLKKAVVSGEAFFPNQKALCAERGIDALQAYGTADLGLVAYETEAREGLVLEESLILEIVRPGTGDPVAPGEVGEVVITSFNPDYPLIRFGTGDLSAVLPGISPCGRTNVRIKGWMGRADQTAKVKGMFVHPEPGGRGHQAPPAGEQGPPGGGQRDRPGPHDPALRSGRHAGWALRCARRQHPRHHQAARRSRALPPGRTAQRRQGHRRRAQV